MAFNLPTAAVKYGSVKHFHIMAEETNMDNELYKYMFNFPKYIFTFSFH